MMIMQMQKTACYKIKITDIIQILHFEIFLMQLYCCLENDLAKIIALSTVITDNRLKYLVFPSYAA